MKYASLIACALALACSPSSETSVIRLVERLEPRTVVRSPLLAVSPSESPVDGLGLVRRGLLLPTPRVGHTRPPFDSNFEILDALDGAPPSHFSFSVAMPRGGRLTFSYSTAEVAQPGNAVTFEVRVETTRETATVFTDTVQGDSALYWRQASVDLTPWAGRTVDLHLVTSSTGKNGSALWGGPIIDGPRSPSEPPNVLLIGIDTLRADRLSAYGYPKATTPRIDALAAEGVRFENAISAANWTAPSFASIFTGLPPGRHGVGSDDPLESDERRSSFRRLASEAVTLAENFRQGGWLTKAIAFKPALFDIGLDQGFDRWFNMPTSRRIGEENLERALSWLADNHDRRFFLFLHLNDPHQPFNQPPSYESPFGVSEARDRLGFRLPITIARGVVKGCAVCASQGSVNPDFVRVARDLYDGEVVYTDHLVGSLVAALKQWGIYDDTIIALLSDHGEILYDRRDRYGHGGRWLTDDLVRIPMILKPHAAVDLPRGFVIEDQVRTTDLLPTLVDLVGLEQTTATADSRSLLDVIRAPGSDSQPAFSENPRRDAVALRTNRWKYIVRPGPRQADYELYDLALDPAERHDVSHDRPDETARLAELVIPYLLRSRPGPFVLVLGDGSGGEFQLILESSRPGTRTTHIFGVPPTLGKDPDDVPREIRGRVVAFAEIALEPEASLDARLLSAGEPLVSRAATRDRMLSYRDGIFDSLLELETPNIYFLHGASQLASAAPVAPPNMDQLEELRALGYID